MIKLFRYALLAAVGSLFLCCPAFAAADQVEKTSAQAHNESAMEIYEKAKDCEKKQDWRSAADEYKKAEILAEDPVLKTNSLTGQLLACRKAKLYGREFDCIEKLLKGHLENINFTKLIDREYQIGDDFFNGHRDVVISWLPFLKDNDRTIEIYEAALKHASCAPQAPDTRLRLGRIYLDKQQPQKAIKMFQDAISLHPETDAARYSRLELAHTYVQLSERGDGDGAWSKLAADTLTDFIEKHPKDPEIPWAMKSLEKVRGITAKRLHGLARFYHRNKRDDLAIRYLSQVVRDFAGTQEAIPSEKMLAEIDKTYTRPPDNAERVPKVKYEFERSAIPLEDSPILVVPENSNGKWLLPVKDLRGDVRIDTTKPLPERKFNDEDNDI